MSERGRWAAVGGVCGVLLAGAAGADAGDVEHRVAGVVPFPAHERPGANVDIPDGRWQRFPQPAWVDGRYWDELVFDALESPDYTDRRTHGLIDSELADLDIYIKTTAPEEGVAPISEDMVTWWRRAIPEAVRQFTGQPWRGRLTTGTDSREIMDGLINVGIGTEEDFEDRDDYLCAVARTTVVQVPGRQFCEVGIHRDPLQSRRGRLWFSRGFAGQDHGARTRARARAVSRLGPGAIMYRATAPDRRYTRQLVDHAQLLYELGPGLPHPGFGPAIPETTPDQWTGSVDQVTYDAARGVVTGRAWHNGAGQDVVTEAQRVVAFFVDVATDLIGEAVRSSHFERSSANTKWEFELPEQEGWDRVFLAPLVFLGDTGEDGVFVDCTDADGRGRSVTDTDGFKYCVYQRSDIEVAGDAWNPRTAAKDLADRALEDLQSQDDEGSSAAGADQEPSIGEIAPGLDVLEAEPVPAVPVGGLGLLAGWLLLMGCRRQRSESTRRNRYSAG